MTSQEDCKAKVSRRRAIRRVVTLSVLFLLLPSGVTVLGARRPAVADPGVRSGPADAGGAIAGLLTNEKTVWNDVTPVFKQVSNVSGSGPIGLGPRFNSNSCVSCHSQPAAGGASPASNPLFSVYQLDGAQNTMPFFEATNTAALDAKFPFLSDGQTPDGTIHQLFTVTGRSDASGCSLSQPNFQ